jgi:hypothetical protein
LEAKAEEIANIPINKTAPAKTLYFANPCLIALLFSPIFWKLKPRLRDDFVNHVSRNISKPEIAATIAVRQLGVIDTQ